VPRDCPGTAALRDARRSLERGEMAGIWGSAVVVANAGLPTCKS